MSNNKKYYLEMEDGSKEYVSEKVFKEYWKLVNRENYLKKLDRKQKILSLNLSDEDGRAIFETLKSEIDVEKIVETAEKIRELHRAIDSLNDEERELIYRLYFDNETLREVAKSKRTTHSSIIRQRNSILKKLKQVLKKI